VAAAAAITGSARPRWDKELPDTTRYLGWCTWDAFYTEVSGKGIAAGLQSFQEAGVQPRWLIIDDGWQRTGLDGAAAAAAAVKQQLQLPQDAQDHLGHQQQQQQQQHRQVRVEGGTGTVTVSHNTTNTNTTSGSSNSTSGGGSSSRWRGSLWWLQRQLKKALGKVERLLLSGISHVADRLNWW
jgi:hypothetical protein